MAAARIVVVIYQSAVYACARRTYRNLVRHGGIPSRCLKIASVDCWLRPFLVPPGIRNACGRIALGGERFESGPSALGIGRGVGTRVGPLFRPYVKGFQLGNSPPF